jgi:hypothetical protein
VVGPVVVFRGHDSGGTTLLVRTNQTVSSNDPVGKTFAAQVSGNVGR